MNNLAAGQLILGWGNAWSRPNGEWRTPYGPTEGPPKGVGPPDDIGPGQRGQLLLENDPLKKLLALSGVAPQK